MKRKVKVVDNVTGKVIVGETEVRNLNHFHAQLTNRSQIFAPKKGKGSYRRNKKVEED